MIKKIWAAIVIYGSIAFALDYHDGTAEKWILSIIVYLTCFSALLDGIIMLFKKE